MAQKQWFVVPLAFGRERNVPMPNLEGMSRCERAVYIAKHIGDRHTCVWIALGANMPHRYAQPFGEQTLADLSERCLINFGWEPLQILKNAKGNNTRTELLAIREVVRCRDRGGVRIRFVTSWWHALRVWLVALLVFRRPIRVSIARTTLSWRILRRELPKEALKLVLEVPCTVACLRAAHLRAWSN